MAKRAAWNSRRTLNRTSWTIADSLQNWMCETCRGRDAVKKKEKIRTQWIWWWVKEKKRVSDLIYVWCNLQEWSVIISINLDKQSDIRLVCFNNFISCSCRGRLFKHYRITALLVLNATKRNREKIGEARVRRLFLKDKCSHYDPAHCFLDCFEVTCCHMLLCFGSRIDYICWSLQYSVIAAVMAKGFSRDATAVQRKTLL